MSSLFTPGRIPASAQKIGDLAFIFDGKHLLVDGNSVPTIENFDDSFLKTGVFFGSIGAQNCYALNYTPQNELLKKKLKNFVLLRNLLPVFNQSISAAACYSSHLLYWHNRSRYCGICGSQTVWSKIELAKVCTKCKEIFYPKISPAVIVAVKKEDKLLLAHNKNFRDGFYSVLAGFVEIGESIEKTAIREIKEEVGIEIYNLQYFYSQAWPFSDSLMIGLTAEYKSGKIKPDGKEILDAGWYSPANFPRIPGQETIAGKLIENFKKTNKS